MSKQVSKLPLSSKGKYAIDNRTGEPWSIETDPWEQYLDYSEELSNAEKIKAIVDGQVSLMYKKAVTGKTLDSRELQTLVICANLIKDIKELDRDIAKVKDISQVSSKDLKKMLKK